MRKINFSFLLVFIFLEACANVNGTMPANTALAITSTPTPIIATDTPIPSPTVSTAQTIFSQAQLSVFKQHHLLFDGNDNLIHTFKDAQSNERTIKVGHLDKDGLHITDYVTGQGAVISPESITNFHQDINELFLNILKGVASKDSSSIWAFNPGHGWFKKIKDGETIDAVAVNDGRVMLSELLDSNAINNLFPADAIPADFYVNFERNDGPAFAYIATFPTPGTIRWDEYYYNNYGLKFTVENNSFHWIRTYKTKSPSGKDAIIRTQVILNKDGKTKSFEHFVFEPGFDPVGDDPSYLYFPLIPPPISTEERQLFDSSSFRFNGEPFQSIGFEFLKTNDPSQNLTAFWSEEELRGLFKDMKRDHFSSAGPVNNIPAKMQLQLLIPIWWENVPVVSGSGI